MFLGAVPIKKHGGNYMMKEERDLARAFAADGTVISVDDV
jgi:hypothetical protein